jgi:hypothetical protein
LTPATKARRIASPAVNQIGVDAMRQRHAGDRGTGPGAGREDLCLEFRRVAAPRPTRSVLHGVHLFSSGHYPQAAIRTSVDAFTGRLLRACVESWRIRSWISKS